MELPGEIFRAIKRKRVPVADAYSTESDSSYKYGCGRSRDGEDGKRKTVAFVIPVLAALQKHSLRNGARALILAPTS